MSIEVSRQSIFAVAALRQDVSGEMLTLTSVMAVVLDEMVFAGCSIGASARIACGSVVDEYVMLLWMRKATPPIPQRSRSSLTIAWFGDVRMLLLVSFVSLSAAMKMLFESIAIKLQDFESCCVIAARRRGRFVGAIVGRVSW